MHADKYTHTCTHTHVPLVNSELTISSSTAKASSLPQPHITSLYTLMYKNGTRTGLFHNVMLAIKETAAHDPSHTTYIY